VSTTLPSRGGKLAREAAPGEVATGDIGVIEKRAVINTKKRKSPSPQGMEDPAAGSALGKRVRQRSKNAQELPLFSTLPPEILHFLGLNAQPRTYAPFTDIILQGSPAMNLLIVRGEAEVIHESANGELSIQPLGVLYTAKAEARPVFWRSGKLSLGSEENGHSTRHHYG